MIRKASLLLTALLLTAGLAGVVGAGPAYAAVRPVIPDVPVFDAPVGGRGGIQSAHVQCSRYTVEPRATMVITSLHTGTSRTYRWQGALPGFHFPRYAPGRYTVRTTAWCSGSRAARAETVRIQEKTARGTMSRTEFDRIRRGMTREQVRAIVGNDGRDPFAYNGRSHRIYDMMAFWRWSQVVFRDGRVVSKSWDVAHD